MSLSRYILKRVLVTIPVLFGVSAITFSFIHIAPGDPVDMIAGFGDVDEEVLDGIREDYNLHLPLWEQYLLWLQDALLLDFGESPITGRDVGASIAARLPHTILLGVSAWVLALGIGIPTGIIAAVKQGETADEVSRIAALAGIATPNFWLGLVLLWIFSVHFGWFSVIPPDAPLLSFSTLWFMILPTITLGTASAALITRLMRSSMLQELNKDYVRTARAKGLRERTVILKHVLRNSLIAVVTVAGLQIAFLIDGAVVVEEVFAWPGMGRLLVGAIFERDFPIIQAGVLLIAVTIIIANLIVDIIYSYLDPRIRY